MNVHVSGELFSKARVQPGLLAALLNFNFMMDGLGTNPILCAAPAKYYKARKKKYVSF